VAKALGMSNSEMPTRGFFMSARRHSRSTISCSRGSCWTVTSWACIENIAILSEKKYWEKMSAAAMTITNKVETPRLSITETTIA
jgi:hypothetical protein